MHTSLSANLNTVTITAVLAFTIVPAALGQLPEYILIDLGTGGLGYTDGRAINDNGHCAGFTGGFELSDRAYRTDSVREVALGTDDLGSLGGTYAQAYGVNGQGQAVGLAGTPGDFGHRAFRTAAGQPINPATDNLGTLITFGALNTNLSHAHDINDLGQVVGVADTGGFPGWPARAFRTAPNAAINPATDDLGTLGGVYSEARGINNSGEVTGLANLSGDTGHHAFRTAPNAAINAATDDLGTLGGLNSVGRDINEAGVVVGEAQIEGGAWRAFRTAGGVAINPATDDLGTLGGSESRATSVNDFDIVVGFSNTTAGQRHAFIFDDEHGIRDLNELVTPASAVGWVLVEARHISNAGEIVGTGTFDGGSRAFVLTPQAPCDPDGDGDFDDNDVALFAGCMGGPDLPVTEFCAGADVDGDADADLEDFRFLQTCNEGVAGRAK